MMLDLIDKRLDETTQVNHLTTLMGNSSLAEHRLA
jgi:hypothetical protein